jgi:hypothetical protein
LWAPSAGTCMEFTYLIGKCYIRLDSTGQTQNTSTRLDCTFYGTVYFILHQVFFHHSNDVLKQWIAVAANV